MLERKPLVLIVDDTPANIHFVSEVLRTEYELKVAINGQSALELANHPEKPALILLDVMMPDLDGYEVCQRLKDGEATKDIPVIFLTAKSDATEEEYGFRLGAADYITKPFAVPVIKARVRSQVNLKLKTDLLASLALLDGLTGLYNRRKFDEALQAEWRRGVRSLFPLSLIMVDVDGFKQYNDHYGHGAGDECLKQVATQLSLVARRPGDLTARYGGEEFVVLLPDTGEAGAAQVAESLRRSIEKLEIPHDGSPVAPCVTISAGCATVVPSPDHSPQSLMKIADANLYRAKRDGRNCVR